MTRRPGRTVWVLNQFDAFPGEGFKLNRYPRMAAAFAEQDAAATWVTGTFSHFSYSRRTLDPAVRARVPYEIALVENRPYRPGLQLSRIQSHRDFARGFLEWAQQPDRRRPDLIVVSLPTLESIEAARQVATACGARLAIDVRDTWPDTFVALVPAVLKPPMRAFVRYQRRRLARLLRAADALICVSDTYAGWTRRILGDDRREVLVAPLGTDLPEEMTEAGAGRGAEPGQPVVTYVGALGLSFDWPTVAAAIPSVTRVHPNVRFDVIGEGRRIQAIRGDVQKSPALTRTVRVLGHMAHKNVMHRLSLSDVGLHTFVPGATQSITNKLIDYIAAGLPIVNSLPGEVSDLVSREQVGRNYAAGDASSLADAILSLLSRPEAQDEMRLRCRRVARRFDARDIYPSMARRLLSADDARGQSRIA